MEGAGAKWSLQVARERMPSSLAQEHLTVPSQKKDWTFGIALEMQTANHLLLFRSAIDIENWCQDSHKIKQDSFKFQNLHFSLFAIFFILQY